MKSAVSIKTAMWSAPRHWPITGNSVYHLLFGFSKISNSETARYHIWVSFSTENSEGGNGVYYDGRNLSVVTAQPAGKIRARCTSSPHFCFWCESPVSDIVEVWRE